jgi:hypothetical protein
MTTNYNNDIKPYFYKFDNSDIQGNDLARKGSLQLSTCASLCYNDDDCLAFTTTAGDISDSVGDCNLKRSTSTDVNFYPWVGIKEDSMWKTYVKNINKRRRISRKNWDITGFNILFPEFKCIKSMEPSSGKNLPLIHDISSCGKIDNINVPIGNGIITRENSCQKVKDIEACSVNNTDFKGSCAVSPCEFSNDKNTGWGFYTSDMKYGWVNCKYSFNYTNFSFNNVNNGLNKFVNYINDLYSDHIGIDINSKNRFRDSNYMYACILEFYSSIYRQYYYSTDNSVNNFKNFDYLRNPILQYKNTYIFPLINTRIQQYFRNINPVDQTVTRIVPVDLQNITNNSLQLPIAIKEGIPPQYKIKLNIPYLMFEEYKNKDQSSRDIYISRLLEGFLRDTEGKIKDRSSRNEWRSERCNIVSTYIEYIYAVNVDSAIYIESIPINTDDYIDTSYKNYLFLYCTIVGTVNTWTPMLSVYFQVKGISLDIATSNIIASRAGYNSTNRSLYPYTSFKADCENASDDVCKALIIDNCKLSYTPPLPFSKGYINNYLTNADSLDCQCYTSTISPPSENQVGNIGAMCFDTKCSEPRIRQMFNLSDSNCKQYIDTVWNWIYNPNTEEKAKNSQTFDTERFDRLTGKEYQPYKPAKYNWQILVIGLFTMILVFLITFILCRKYSINTLFTFINLVVIIVIIGGLTTFFSIDMAGLSSCDRNEFKCKSRYTDIDLPNEFCNYTLNCECQFNEDCRPCSYCFSGTCAPAIGTRKTITVSERKPNVVVLILSVVLLVLLPIILMFLHDKNLLNISSWLFNSIIIIVCLIPLIFIVYNSLKKVDFTKYDGNCSQECNSSCEGKSCGYNECGQICGTCESGYTCNEQNVCEII